MKYFESSETCPAPFTLVKATEPPTKKLKIEEHQVGEVDLVESSLNLLLMAPDYFKHLWNWTDFAKQFLSHKDPKIRWIVCQCLAIISGMGENSRTQFMAQQNLSDQEIRTCTLKYYRKIQFSTEHFQKTEMVNIVLKQTAHHHSYCTFLQTVSSEVPKNMLSDNIVDVEGVLLQGYCLVSHHFSTNFLLKFTNI